MEVKSRYTDTSTGYVKLYIPGLGVIDEHRYVMQNMLGRTLAYNEVIHHKDGNKQNNAPSNLTLTDRSSHARSHHSYHIVGPAMVELVCANCGIHFSRRANQVNAKLKRGQIDFYCGCSCAAKAFGRGRPKK